MEKPGIIRKDSLFAWEHEEKLGSVAADREVWADLLSLLPLWKNENDDDDVQLKKV